MIAAYLGVEDEEVEKVESGGRAMTAAAARRPRRQTFYGNIRR